MNWIRKNWLLFLIISIALLSIVGCSPSTATVSDDAVVSEKAEDTIVRNAILRGELYPHHTVHGGCYALYTEILLKIEIQPGPNTHNVYSRPFSVILKAYPEGDLVKIGIIVRSSNRFENQETEYILSQGDSVTRSFDILFYDTWYRTQDVEILTFVRTEHLLDGRTNYCIEFKPQQQNISLSRILG